MKSSKAVGPAEVPRGQQTSGKQRGISSVLFLFRFSCVPTTSIKECYIFRYSERCIHYRSQLLKAHLAGGVTEQSWLPHDGLFLSHLVRKQAVPLNCTCREAKVQSPSVEGAMWASCNCGKSHVNLQCIHGLLTFKQLFSIYFWSQKTQWHSEN